MADEKYSDEWAIVPDSYSPNASNTMNSGAMQGGYYSDEWAIVPDEPQPSLWQETQGVANRFLKGAANLGGFAYDLAATPYRMAKYENQKMQGQTPESPFDFSTGSKLASALASIKPAGLFNYPSEGFDYMPQTTGGKIAGGVAEMLPSVAVPMGGIASRASGAVLGGLGSGAADAAGTSPLMQALAGMGASIAPGMAQLAFQAPKALLQAGRNLVSTAGREQLAANTVQNLASGEDLPALKQALMQVAENDPLAQFKSTAELTRSPGLARLETDLGRADLGDGDLGQAAKELVSFIPNRMAARQEARSALLDALTSPIAKNTDEIARGMAMQDISRQNWRQEKKVGDEIYKAFKDAAQGSSINLEDANNTITQNFGNYFARTSKQPSEETEAILDLIRGNSTKAIETGLVDASGNAITKTMPAQADMSFRDLDALISRAKNHIATLPKVGGDKSLTESGFMKSVVSTLDRAIKEGVEDPTAKQILEEARTNWARIKDTYETGLMGKIVGTTGRGRSNVYPSEIARKIFDRPETTRAYVNASAGNTEARELLKGYAVKTLQEQTPGRWGDWVQKHELQLKSLFGDRDYKTFQTVVDDIASENWVGQAAFAPSKRQSATQQWNVVNALKRDIKAQINVARNLGYGGVGLGLGTGNIPGAIASGALSYSAEKIGQAAQHDINKLLIDVAFNPQTAALMLSKPTPENMTKVIGQILTNTKDAGMTAALAGVAKMYGAQEPGKPPQAPANITASKVIETQPIGETAMLPVPPDTTASSALLDAIISVESGGDEDAVSSAGAQGIMQLIPATGKAYHKKLGIKEPYDAFNKEQNKQIGKAYLDDMIAKYGDLELAIAAYNMGETNLNRFIAKYGKDWAKISPHLKGEFLETQKYVPTVLNRLG